MGPFAPQRNVRLATERSRAFFIFSGPGAPNNPLLLVRRVPRPRWIPVYEGWLAASLAAFYSELEMAKLTAARRKALPKSTFAGPDRSYPVPDKSHAANAKARASQAVNAGRMSSSEKEKIDAKANAVLGKNFHDHPGN